MRRALPLLAVLLTTPVHAADWSDPTERDGVQIAKRDVAGSSVQEVRAIATLSQPIASLRAVLADIEAYPRIMPPTVAAKLLRRTGNAAIWHMVVDAPVVSMRDYCAEITNTDTPGGTKVTWQLTNELCPPPASGHVRMVANRGSWTLRAVDDKHTEVTYQVHADPGGRLPVWMVNRAVVKVTARLFGDLEKAASLAKYARAKAVP